MKTIGAIFGGMILFASVILFGGQGTPQDQSQNPPPAQQQTDQSQQQTNQQQTDQQQPKKKKGGFFGGLKSVSGSGSEQTEDTAAAGTKGVGEGAKISNVTPTSADRSKVSAMESYSVPDKDLKQFQQDGKLASK